MCASHCADALRARTASVTFHRHCSVMMRQLAATRRRHHGRIVGTVHLILPLVVFRIACGKIKQFQTKTLQTSLQCQVL